MMWIPKLPALRGELVRCRGCLKALDAAGEAGLCGRCWSGLLPLPEGRCPTCALSHEAGGPCPEPVAWAHGDALWDYHGGRPPLGALLLPAIKQGDWGWKTALERRIREATLPDFAAAADLLVPVPTAPWKPWARGFDLGADVARILGARLDRPVLAALGRAWWRRGQTGRTESDRRRMPRKALRLRPEADLEGRVALLVDDVWTTGTTLLRCAERLAEGGTAEVRVLTVFRALTSR